MSADDGGLVLLVGFCSAMEAQTILNDIQLLPLPRLVHYAILCCSRPLQLMGHNTLMSALIREIFFSFYPLLVCLSCAGLVASINLATVRNRP